jgi:hypothetical protein
VRFFLTSQRRSWPSEAKEEKEELTVAKIPKATAAIAVLAGVCWGRKLPDQKLAPPCDDVHVISLDLGVLRLQGNVVSTSEKHHPGFDLYVSFEDKNGPVPLANDVRIRLGELPPMQGVPFWVNTTGLRADRATLVPHFSCVPLSVEKYITEHPASKPERISWKNGPIEVSSLSVDAAGSKTLKERYYVVNDERSPISISDVVIMRLPTENLLSWVLKPVGGKVTAAEDVTSIELHIMLFDSFGDHVKTLNFTHTGDIEKGTEFRLSSAGKYWPSSANSAEEFLTSIAFVSRVRTAVGAIWRFDADSLLTELRKLIKDLKPEAMTLTVN